MLTQEQWYRKLKSWVPGWYFSSEYYNVAVFKAIAKLLSTTGDATDSHFVQTFLSGATGEFLDAHGDERRTPRITGEPDELYRERIRNIVNKSNKPDIKTIVDALLIVGECTIIEHATDGPYLNRNTYLNRNFVFTDRRYYNYYTVLIDKQVPISDSFCNRSTHANRMEFMGTGGALPIEVLLAIINASIDKARAAGVMYRFIEK